MEKFGKFQLLELIGTGGMAEIYLARPSDAALSKLVAVKRMLPELAQQAYYRDMFRREGEIALRFRHPSIVTVHELGKVASQDYMSMEFFPGKTVAQLRSSLQDNLDVLSIPDRLVIIKSIADALQYIHDFSDHGAPIEIIHRDISPQNILVGFDGETKLIDFGVARVNNEEEGTGSKDVKGKIAYMSPEQVRGDTLTKQTDVFSLGIVLWEMITGHKLFTGKSAHEVSTRVEACDIPKLERYASDLPPELGPIVYKALARNPKDRFETAGELSMALEDVLRLFPRDRHHKRIAAVLQQLYPEDVQKLQALLKKHEHVKHRDVSEATQLLDLNTPTTSITDTGTETDSLDSGTRTVPDTTPDIAIHTRPAAAKPAQAPAPRPPSETVSTTHMLAPHTNAAAAKPPPPPAPKPKPVLKKKVAAKAPETFETAEPRRRDPSRADKTSEPGGAGSTPLILASSPDIEPPRSMRLVSGGTTISENSSATWQRPYRSRARSRRATGAIIATGVLLVLVVAVRLDWLHKVSNLVHPASVVESLEETSQSDSSAQTAHTAYPAPSLETLKTSPQAHGDRNVAAQPQTFGARAALAYLTVIADPGMHIWINGSEVGVEMVTNLKVRSGQNLIIEIYNSSGRLQRARAIALKPSTRTVVDFGGTTGYER